ncbi:MAG: Wzz/FepE/Etk N-terminal domain-containing protein [Xanthobacteraceae bacterium]
MFKYDRPVEPPATSAGERQRAAVFDIDLLGLIAELWRRRIFIVAVAFGCACLAVAVGKSLTPRYTATAQLYVDPRELQLVERELTPRAQDMSGLAIVAESQARFITSNSVLLRVIKDTKIDKDSEFGGKSTSFFAPLWSMIGRRAPTASADLTEALDLLNRHVSVKRTDRTFIVDIDVWSHDPAKAAMLANAIATAYLAESRQSQSTAVRRATTDLSSRLKELQQRLRTAENKLADYKARNNFVGSQDTLISDQQLSAITQRLAAARAVTLDAQAKYDQIEQARRNAVDPGAMPEALQSPTIANLRAQYSDTRKRYAELRNELGPRHPTLMNMQRQVEDLRRNINDEVNRYAVAAQTDLARARDFEASLTKELERQKQQSVNLSQASVQARELERDVEASRAVYLSFLKRSRETEEQETLNTSSARVIGEAVQPRTRTFPPAMSLLAMIGFVLGGLAAAGYVFMVSRLRASETEPGRTPDDTVTSPPMAPVGPKHPAVPLKPAIAMIEKPLLACLQEADVLRTLGGIMPTTGKPDLTRMGWPTLRASGGKTFRDAVAKLCAAARKRTPDGRVPVIAVIGLAREPGRSVVSANLALAAARDGAQVLIVDADVEGRALSARLGSAVEPKKAVSLLSFGTGKAMHVPVGDGVAAVALPSGLTAEAAGKHLRKTVAQAQATPAYNLVLIEGPAMPWDALDLDVLSAADALVVVLPTRLDINQAMEEILDALGDGQQKLIGVILNEVDLTGVGHDRGKQHA